MDDHTGKFDWRQRMDQKQRQREQDIRALMEKKITKRQLHKQNSMFSGIDWSEVTILEPNGYKWKATPKPNSDTSRQGETPAH